MKKICLLFFVMASFAFAKEVTLEEAIDRSLENSRSIQVSEKNLEISKISMKQAIKKALPAVFYSGAYQRGEYDRMIATSKTNSEKGKAGYKQAIKISQPLFQGGAIIAGIQGAKAYENLAEIQYLQEKVQTRLKAIQTFSKIVNAQKDLQALDYSKKQLEQRYKKQEAQLELRLITKTDLLKTEYNILAVQSQIEKAKSDIEIQKENLKIQMAFAKEEDIEVKDFVVPQNLTEQINPEKDMKQALESSMQSLTAKYQVEISKAQEKASVGNMLPKVNAFASYGNLTERNNFARSQEDAEWVGGVEFTWNIFSFGSEYDSYKIAKLQKESQEISEQDSQDSIRLGVREAYLELCRLEILRQSKTKALEAAELNFEMDQEKYDAGLISIIDYLDSEKQLREAKVSFNQTELDYYYAFEFYRSLLV